MGNSAVTPDSPILGPTPPGATVAAALNYVSSRGDLGPTVRPLAVAAYVQELFRLCLLAGIDFRIAVAQACDECNVFRDKRFWGEFGNPVGYGAEESLEHPGQINYTGGTWTPVGAARVHLVHLWLYASGPVLPSALAEFRDLDTRWTKALPEAGNSPTLAGLSGRWAANPNYASQIAAHANRAFKEESPMPTTPAVLITRGHGTTGDIGAVSALGDAEETHNRRIVVAVAAALRGAGYDVTTFPADPTQDVAGTLDTEGMAARTWIAAHPGEVVMIDCHLEKSPARGIFGIVANDVGLVTGAVGAQPATDLYANNVGDRALADAICEEVHARTGIPIRTAWVKEPGIMSEDMTWVGQGGGGAFPPSRLAMFGYTAEFHQRAYRLIVEFANLDNDRDYYRRPDFPERCGAGVLAAMDRIFGEVVPPPPPKPTYAKRQPPPLPPATQLVNDDPWIRFGRTMVAVEEAPALQFAMAGAKQVAPPFPKGKRANFVYVVVGSDGQAYYVSKSGTRTPARCWRDG